MDDPQAAEHLKRLRSFSKLLTQFLSAGIGAFHLRGGVALGRHETRPQAGLDGQLPVGPVGRLRQFAEQRQPLEKMADTLTVRRALHGLLSGVLPESNRLIEQAGFGVMVGD